MNGLFQLPGRLPEVPKSIRLYQTSADDPEKMGFGSRLNAYADAFKLRSRPQDHGDSVVYQERTFELEVFKASDSVWWEHKALAYREIPPEDTKLPSKRRAVELAERYLERYGLSSGYAKFSHVSYTNVIHIDRVNKSRTKYETEVNVNYGFDVDGLPVAGPGAKIQVSFVERGRLCELYRFWREPKVGMDCSIIGPEKALEKLCEDESFRQLSPRNASVKLDSIELVLYSMPPPEVQRYYIPSYRIEGTVTTEYHRHEFTDFVNALDLTEQELKREGIVNDMSFHGVF